MIPYFIADSNLKEKESEKDLLMKKAGLGSSRFHKLFNIQSLIPAIRFDENYENEAPEKKFSI